MIRTKESLVLATAIALTVCMVAGCNRPTSEMKRAEAAIEEAKKAGASEWAPKELSSAEESLAEGIDLMDGFQYKQARAAFEEAYRHALAARDRARSGHTAEEFTPSPLLSVSMSRPYSPPTSHTVYEGECLWRIAEYRDIYDDPFQWPLIYDANRNKIDRTAHSRGIYEKEENWIFPGQEFDIPRNMSTHDIKDARRRSGAPTPYTPPGM